MANKIVKIKKVRENAELPISHNGNWFDCYVSGISVIPSHRYKYQFDIPKEPQFTNGTVSFFPSDVVVIYLGFACDMGEKYEGHVLPRSGTFRKHGLILTNSMGLIDDSYKGDEDEWKGVFYSTRGGKIKIGDRLLQMTIQRSNPIFELKEVDSLGNANRGGYGSTGE